MYIGINAHPVHDDFAIAELERFDLVRYPVWSDVPWVRQYQQATSAFLAQGTQPLIVLDGRSLAIKERGRYVDNRRAIDKLYRRYPNVTYWQCGNEMDQVGESSWTMDPADYLRLLDDAVAVLPRNKVIIAGGLVSGDVSYIRHLRGAPVDKIALHFYGAVPSRKDSRWLNFPGSFGDVMDGVDAYREALGEDKPVWVTEFGWETGAFNSKAERQAYYEDMLVELSDGGVEAALPYCWSRGQCGDLALKGRVRI